MTTQFGPFQDATLENLIELGQSLASQVEKITRLQVEAGLASSREAMTAAQALMAVKDPEGLSSWQATYLQPNFDRAADSARQQYAVLMETREILADAVKQSTADATRQIQDNLDRLAEGAPEGFAPLFQAIRKGLDTQNAAFESFSKVADRIGDIAEANLLALKDAAVPAPKRSVAKRKAA
ncbi:phasin family protein [Zoogloea sp.]|jgi:phasin family protein|uniref:phasin family protein n=1 Tax=Zoogloea sp. TaxID=49181 RepID=UPI0035AF2FD4